MAPPVRRSEPRVEDLGPRTPDAAPPRGAGGAGAASAGDAELGRVLAGIGAPSSSDLPWAALYGDLQALATLDPSSLGAEQRRRHVVDAARGSRALILLSGMEAFFGGRLRQALSRLSLAPAAAGDGIDGAAPAELRSLEAHIALFRAATRLRLFRLGGALESELTTQAAADLQACRELDPDLRPAATYFSPAFRAVFDAAAP